MTLSQEQQCKGCGLMVQSGYARCPRCKMPQAPAKRIGRAETQIPGGTAVESSGNRVTVIAAVALLALALVLYMTAGGGDSKKAPESAEEEEVVQPATEIAAPVPRPTARPSDESVGFSGVERVADPAEEKRDVLDQVTQKLGQKRLWATLNADRSSDSLLIVVSSSCEEPAMKPAITDASALLRQVGFETLRCVEKSGALVFEQGL